MRGALRRDEAGVSAAVATVLLFGGVLSIIGLMMVSMMPVIEEMEGSVERHDMSSQMTLLAHETSALAERGMPGDSAGATLIPVDGELKWDSLRGGMWYSATWVEDMSLRARGALDFDDQLEIRHPESFVESVCITDLRLGPDRPYHYTLDAVLDRVSVTVTPGLAMPLGPIEIQLVEDGVEVETTSLRVDEMTTLDLQNRGETVLSSSHALTVFASIGEGGTGKLTANKLITQTVQVCAEEEKFDNCMKAMGELEEKDTCIVFCGTKRRCDFLDRKLRQSGIHSCGAIHGDKDQYEREKSLDNFRKGRGNVLVATDVAARGLDIPGVAMVLIYDFPGAVEDYVHRIGRTGRAGKTGIAHTLFTKEDSQQARELVQIMEGANQTVPPELQALVRTKGSGGGGRGGRWSGGRGGGRGGGGRGGRGGKFSGRSKGKW